MTNSKPRNQKLQEKILKDIQQNNISILQTLKSQNPLFHWSSISYKQTGDTALHIAARLGHLAMIDYLLTEYSPCLVNIKNKDDKTPLHEAAQFTQLHSVKKLCSYGADVNALRRGDWTPLMLACTKIQSAVSLSIVQNLVDKGAEINYPNKDGWTCLHILAREGGLEILDYLIGKGLITRNGRTALHITALHGNKEILSKLLKYLNVNSMDGCGNTPLHEALLGQHLDLARILVENKANIHITNNSGLSLLHLVATQDSTEIIEYVLGELNFDVDYCGNKNGWTAAHCAARKGSKEVFEYLITKGADVSLKDNFGRTAKEYFNLLH
ncbi:ankyrin repeat domain-containing protein 16-like isoform X2 [Euwallacea fornicatus]|uniref:ankyrin repeat domain-containing protein 16-like isoform X2 n=1 Tax=Euwallacea fornicatus TaxID=995702 RepID=UPI00338D398D